MNNIQVSQATILLLTFVLLFTGCDRNDQVITGVPATLSSVVDVIRLEGGDWGYPSPFAHYLPFSGSWRGNQS